MPSFIFFAASFNFIPVRVSMTSSAFFNEAVSLSWAYIAVFSFSRFPVFRFRYGRKPNRLAFLCVWIYGNVGETAVRYGSVPVFHVRQDLNYIAFLQKPGRLPTLLTKALAVRNKQNLSA
jgi:hypothetical protein